jgi:glycosidase
MPLNNSSSKQKSLNDLNIEKIVKDHGKYYPSPVTWEDEVLYFLMLDRFSDGSEYGGFGDISGNDITGPVKHRQTALFDVSKDAWTADREIWFENGQTWCGGNLKGLIDKLGYLRRMNITCIWLSPVLKQVKNSNDYHGYGTQNFLDLDPHFGSKDDLKNFVSNAHSLGIRVILDIVINHTGDVFAYKDNNPYYYFDGEEWPYSGFRKNIQDPGTLPFQQIDLAKYPEVWPDEAVWPAEFQDPTLYTRQGEIRNWDTFPEYLDGDFFSLKDIDHGKGPRDPAIAWDLLKRITEFNHTNALLYLCKIYKYWIAFADVDGYRIDTVKHLEPGAVCYFTNVIHEFAQSIGKENFYIIAEITGTREFAVDIVQTTGVDAGIGIADVRDKIEYLAKGKCSPGNPDTPEQEGYFDLFTNNLADGLNSHQWYSKHIVVLADDHDKVGVQHKSRFCGDEPDSYKYLKAVFGLNLTTMGIPCIYYGDEVSFNDGDKRIGNDDSYSDVYLRACMFGGRFGSFQSTGKHFFNEKHEVYQFVSKVCDLRNKHIVLRRGRQFLREISNSGQKGDFWYPQPINGELRWVVAWSRIFADSEYVCAINTDPVKSYTVFVTLDHELNPVGSKMYTCIFSTDNNQIGSSTSIKPNNGSSIQITVPPAGFVIYA